MKRPTSWTAQQEMRRCPRRFFYRYSSLDPNGHLKALKSLRSVRELGGEVIHAVLADCVRGVAQGERISDLDGAPGRALDDFISIVERSKHIPPGSLLEGRQLAETFNGVPCENEIADWEEIIPICVQNGLRLMHYFRLRANQEGYQMMAEQRRSFLHRGREHRMVIDVLINDGGNTSVIDWKCHQTTDSDLQQVALYQRYLQQSEQIPPTRLYGFVANLLDEQVVEHHYRAIEHTFAPIHTSRPSAPWMGTRPHAIPADPYPARPSMEACGICPFATVCPASALLPPQPQVLEGAFCER